MAEMTMERKFKDGFLSKDESYSPEQIFDEQKRGFGDREPIDTFEVRGLSKVMNIMENVRKIKGKLAGTMSGVDELVVTDNRCLPESIIMLTFVGNPPNGIISITATNGTFTITSTANENASVYYVLINPLP